MSNIVPENFNVNSLIYNWKEWHNNVFNPTNNSHYNVNLLPMNVLVCSVCMKLGRRNERDWYSCNIKL